MEMDIISKLIYSIIEPAAAIMLPLMIFIFVIAAATRYLIWYLVKGEYRFSIEFQKRTRNYLMEPEKDQNKSFHDTLSMLLNKTFHETFELRRRYQRRNLDFVMSLTDRLFLVESGAERIVQDTLERTKFLQSGKSNPQMIDFTKGIFEGNPFFNRLAGIFQVNMLNEFVNILPSLFVVGGIFGTFLGIVKGIPELGKMDIANAEESKRIMDIFLKTISFAMIKSIAGIGLSVMMTLINIALSPDHLYYQVINRFSDALERIWNLRTDNFNSGRRNNAEHMRVLEK